jgi:hypothetical protein
MELLRRNIKLWQCSKAATRPKRVKSAHVQSQIAARAVIGSAGAGFSGPGP